MHKSMLNHLLSNSCGNPAFYEGNLRDNQPAELPAGFTEEDFIDHDVTLHCAEYLITAAQKPEPGPNGEIDFEVLAMFKIDYETEYTTPNPPRIYTRIPLS